MTNEHSQIHAKIMLTCTLFAPYTANLSKALMIADPGLARPRLGRPGNRYGSGHAAPLEVAEEERFDQARLDKLGDNVAKYEENFSRHLKILLDALNYYAATETVVLLGLCARLSTASNEADSGGTVMMG